MESGLVVLTVVAMIVVGVFIFLMDKAKSAASRALTQKVLYRKKFEQGKHLLEGMTLDSAAPCERLLGDLQTRVAVSDPPTGLANRLYTAGRQGNRIEYVYGNKFGDSFRARVVILEHGERSLGIFKVIRWHEQEGIIVAQDWMKTLFEQVRAVVVAADPAATFTEGISDARLKKAAAPDAAAKAEETTAAATPEPVRSAESDDAVARAEVPATQVPTAPLTQAPAPIAVPTKRMNTWSYIGTAVMAAAILWIGTVGVPDDLMPVWILVAGAGGAMFYFSTRAPRAGAVPTRPAQPGASEPPRSPAESASVLEAPAPVDEPSMEEFERAAEELSVAARQAEAGAAAPATPTSKLVPRIVIAVAALVIVAIVGGALVSGISKQIDKADREQTAEEPQEDVAVEPATVASEPDLTFDYGALRTIDLYDRAPASGDMQFRDIVYTGAGEYFGGDRVLLGFMLLGPEGEEEFLADLPTDIGCYVDYEQVSFEDLHEGSYGASGMIVFNNQGVYELHVFTKGQAASASVSGSDTAPGDDIASSEGDTASFVHFVQDEGGELLINAEPDGERVYSRPSIMMVRSAEPFFEWAIPLSDSYEYSIGGRPVTGYELFEYISLHELVRVDVVCHDNRIVSINCWEE